MRMHRLYDGGMRFSAGAVRGQTVAARSRHVRLTPFDIFLAHPYCCAGWQDEPFGIDPVCIHGQVHGLTLFHSHIIPRSLMDTFRVLSLLTALITTVYLTEPNPNSCTISRTLDFSSCLVTPTRSSTAVPDVNTRSNSHMAVLTVRSSSSMHVSRCFWSIAAWRLPRTTRWHNNRCSLR